LVVVVVEELLQLDCGGDPGDGAGTTAPTAVGPVAAATCWVSATFAVGASSSVTPALAASARVNCVATAARNPAAPYPRYFFYDLGTYFIWKTRGIPVLVVFSFTGWGFVSKAAGGDPLF
jgi:hypothetical protein